MDILNISSSLIKYTKEFWNKPDVNSLVWGGVRSTALAGGSLYLTRCVPKEALYIPATVCAASSLIGRVAVSFLSEFRSDREALLRYAKAGLTEAAFSIVNFQIALLALATSHGDFRFDTTYALCSAAAGAISNYFSIHPFLPVLQRGALFRTIVGGFEWAAIAAVNLKLQERINLESMAQTAAALAGMNLTSFVVQAIATCFFQGKITIDNLVLGGICGLTLHNFAYAFSAFATEMGIGKLLKEAYAFSHIYLVCCIVLGMTCAYFFQHPPLSPADRIT